jgi:hypothetical protein
MTLIVRLFIPLYVFKKRLGGVQSRLDVATKGNILAPTGNQILVTQSHSQAHSCQSHSGHSLDSNK